MVESFYSSPIVMVRRNFFRGVPLQQGAGFVSILSRLFRMIAPVLTKSVKNVAKTPQFKNAVRSAKKSALTAAVGVGGDVISGVNPKKKLKMNLAKAQTDLESALSSSGPPVNKRRRKVKAMPSLSVRRSKSLLN